MRSEKGPKLSGARLEGADFSNARLHAPSFEGAKITDACFYSGDFSGDLEGLRLNGVEVAPLVAAERARLFPEPTQLQAAGPQSLADPNREHTVLACLHVIINEEWEHHRYAVRDLDVLEDH